MKLFRIKRSTTFKTHFFSALCRSLFTNSSLIFINSVFVKSVGSKSYSELFFFASLASIFYYVHFALRGDKEAYTVYKTVIWLTIVASSLCFLEQHWSVLEPYNKPLLYCFAVSVVVIDLIGTTLGPVILQLSVKPAIFKEVYQKIVTAELVARIAAAFLVWFLSINHWLEFTYAVGWLTLIIHFILFNVTVVRLRIAERESIIKSKDSYTASARAGEKEPAPLMHLGKAVKFIFSNSMVRIAMIIMIWSQVAKFFVEYLFYQVADDRFSSARQLASFVSISTMAMILLSLLAQHFVGKRLTQRLQLSTLFSFQPVNILVLGGIALIFKPFWSLVTLLVTYNIINRCIQLPVSRQCLVPVPRKRRAMIVSLICIMMSSATLMASGSMTVLKEALQFQDFLLMLLCFAGGMLFLVTGLDTYYIRNLWSFYRESRSGRWQDEPVVENFSTVELEATGSVEDPSTIRPTADLKSHPILEIYAASNDKADLLYVTRDHKQLLNSTQLDLILLGLRIAFITGFPWFTSLLNQSLSHRSYEVRKFARLAMRVNAEFKDIQGFSSVFQRRIKGLALEVISDEPQSEKIEKLKRLISLSDREAADSLVQVLTDARFLELRSVLLNCIGEDDLSLSLRPVVEAMYEHDYQSSFLYREALARLSFGRNRPELVEIIEDNLRQLKRDELNLGMGSNARERETGQLQRFMHTLFAEEFRFCPSELDHTLTDTIGEFSSLPPEDTSMLIDMHLEFLKRSQFFRTWRSLLG